MWSNNANSTFIFLYKYLRFYFKETASYKTASYFNSFSIQNNIFIEFQHLPRRETQGRTDLLGGNGNEMLSDCDYFLYRIKLCCEIANIN